MWTNKETEILMKCGGRPVDRPGLIGAVTDMVSSPAFNFGVKPKTERVRAVIDSKPSLHTAYPALAGKWDGKATINHWDAILAVCKGDWVKAEEFIQYQVRGTCGGRAGSFAADAIQAVMIATQKKNAKLHRVSHAAVYYMALKLHNWINPNIDWRDENQDGVASGSVPEAIARMGAVQREEDSDLKWYGDGSDDLACQLAAGLHSDVAAKILEFGSDNLITEWTPVKNAQELADGIAAGGIGIGSDTQGFTMTRDSQGFCRPSGTWSHYQCRTSVGNWGGRKGFGYNQSWGKKIPGGPGLPGHPGNCFGVDFDVQDRIIKSGDWAVVFGFPLWDLQSGNVNIPWIF